MNKCFITKLPSSVDNDNLPVLGQLRINWLRQSNLANNDSRAIGLATNDSIVVKVSGAHLTDNTLASNLGNTKTITAADGLVWLYVSNDADAILTIDNKYALTQINVIRQDGEEYIERSIYFDIEDIRYCTNLTYISLLNTQVSGDISAVSKLTNLTQLSLLNTQVSGNISAVSKLTNLISLNLSDTQVSGDIENLSGLTKLLDLTQLKGLTLTGDMSKIPANILFISQINRKVNTNFTWTAGGRQNATLLSMEGQIPFDTTSMDNMFIDQATCTVSPQANNTYQKIIAVSGTRTSASDAAVAAIQNKGITITGVTKQA